VSIPAHCGSCRRELLLDQLLQPSDGFRCPFCGFAFAPSYATIAPGVASRILASQAALVRSLGELQSMIDGRLQLDRSAVVAPIADALPAEPQPAGGGPGAARRDGAHVATAPPDLCQRSSSRSSLGGRTARTLRRMAAACSRHSSVSTARTTTRPMRTTTNTRTVIRSFVTTAW
jgi:hypothetical protein